MTSGALVVTTGLALALASPGCNRGPKTTPKTGQRVRVHSFTEASPIRALAVAPPYVFSATDRGMDRWDLRTGAGLQLSAEHGLPGDKVSALSYDSQRGWLWVATDGGVTRYEVKSGTFAELPPAPKVLGIGGFEGVSLAPAGDGGLWIGHANGLFYTNGRGQWTNTGVTAPVTSLLRARDGRLWIGTKRGLIVRQPSGETFEYGEQEGCDLDTVRFIVRAPDGGPLIVGENAAGTQRIVFVFGDNCASYRSSPDTKWSFASSRGDDVVILSGRRFYSLHASGKTVRRLTREGMRLRQVRVGPDSATMSSPYVMRALDVNVPTGARNLAAATGEVLVGTRDLGTARLVTGDRPGRTRWLRRGELVDGASSLSVACVARDDCYVATGARFAWHLRGASFSRLGDGTMRILSVVRSPTGEIFGLRQSDDSKRTVLSRIRDETWVRVSEIEIETPGVRPQITFARFSPSGVLWLGLEYRDKTGEERPFGVALVDVSLGAVAYHHASSDSREVEQGVLQIPISVKDACFMDDDETWLATSEGAARIRGNKVTVFSEGEGLRSEFLRGIACSAGGIVFVASGQGLGAYDGDSWTYPPVLRAPVNDIEIARDSRLWMATDRGVVVYDGARVRRLDLRRGLIDNEIEDVALDQFGRVWARGAHGFTVVTP